MRRSITCAVMACIAVFLTSTANAQSLDYSMRGYRPVIQAANGNLLGTVVTGRDDGLQVLAVSLVGDDLDAVPFLLDGSLVRGIAQNVYFEGPDCVGEPLIEPRSAQGAPLSVFLASVVLRIRPGSPAYLERQEEPVMRAVRSGYRQEGTCSNSNPTLLPLVTMKPVALSLDDFPPPYQLLRTEPQDVDVPGNLTMHDSADPTTGNVLKEGVPFIHNFGFQNTFVGSGAGNFAMTHPYGSNTATGFQALHNNIEGFFNTATGAGALKLNTSGIGNTASGSAALVNNTTGSASTAVGYQALFGNTTGNENTASGFSALLFNTTGYDNTASGANALVYNTTGSNNTALGSNANVSSGDLTNATAIGALAVVDASNKIRLGNTFVTVIEGQVPYTYTSDRNEKENFRSVDAEAVLAKLRGLSVTSWNYKGQDAKQFRHYGPVAQDFFAAFGHDAVGTIGTPTTITSGDLDGILMVAAQALEKRTAEQEKEIAQLKARLEALEHRGCKVAASLSAEL